MRTCHIVGSIGKRSMKNVVHVIIDAMRYDYFEEMMCIENSMLPNIRWVKENGICFSSFYVNGAPTQMALPSIFSSTYPLDYGGYNTGMSNRPIYLQEVLHREHYQTEGYFMTSPASNLPRGYDFMESVITERDDLPKLLRHVASKLVKSPFKSSSILSQDIVSKFDKIITDMSEVLCDSWIEIFLQKYVKNKRQYIITKSVEHSLLGLLNVINKKLRTNKVFHIKLVKLYWRYDYVVHHNDFCKKNNIQCSDSYVSAASITEKALCRITPGMKKKYLYVHYMDVHESTPFTYDIGEENEIEREFKSAQNIIGRLETHGYSKEEASYMASMQYVDNEIGKILFKLRTCNLMKDTIIIVSADHGQTKPRARKNAHVAKDFFDEIYHVPLIICDGINKYDDNRLMSSIDFAPTLLTMLGINQESNFKGKTFFDLNPLTEKYEIIMMEHTGRWECNPYEKEVTICIRSKKWKVVYKDKLFDVYKKNHIYQIFDLINDPKEKNNLSTDDTILVQTQELITAAKQRIEDLRVQYERK